MGGGTCISRGRRMGINTRELLPLSGATRRERAESLLCEHNRLVAAKGSIEAIEITLIPVIFYPLTARSSPAMSMRVMPIMASKARLARARSESAIRCSS